MAADHAPVRQGRTNVCVCGELVADHRWFGPDAAEPPPIGELVAVSGWILDHPAETVALLTEAGVLVRSDCDECNDRGVVYDLDGNPGDCHICDGGKHPLYWVSLPTRGDEQ